MSDDTRSAAVSEGGYAQADDRNESPRFSRRDLLKSGAAGLAAGGLVGAGVGAGITLSRASQSGPPREGGRILLRGGVVLSLDAAVGDFEQADVLVEGKKILAVGPNLEADGQIVDCRGTIVMPGFISTHNHQYEAIQRSILADGLIVFPGDADQQQTDPSNAVYEAYGTVVQNIWTAGRLVGPPPANTVIWDLGRSPYDPEDCYIAELVACLSQITQGITCGTDTSQCSHTPAHTDAMIKGLMDSGRRSLYDYTGGIDRSVQDRGQPYEFPWPGLQRIAKTYFSSKDQLVTLGFAGGPTPIPNLPAPYTGMTGWKLGREFGAFINNHNVGNAAIPRTALDNDLAPFDDVTLVHCVRWQDSAVAQTGSSHAGYPSGATSEAWKIWADNGGHVSIAVLIEQQMRHGMPPMQLALNHGILPSLSPDVDTNMTADPFSMMRGAFCLQRALANDLTFASSDPGRLPTPQLVTSRQCVEMMTIAGAAASGLLDRVGTLTPGKEADVVILDYNTINYQPMNNAYGTIVTMMDTRAVKHVMIAGKFVYWQGTLVGWDAEKLTRQVVESRDRVLARINGPATGANPEVLHRGKNSSGHPYKPAFLTSCCFAGQNEAAPQYVLRP